MNVVHNMIYTIKTIIDAYDCDLVNSKILKCKINNEDFESLNYAFILTELYKYIPQYIIIKHGLLNVMDEESDELCQIKKYNSNSIFIEMINMSKYINDIFYIQIKLRDDTIIEFIR